MSNTRGRLSGKTALVTGGARGIGAAIVETFLAQGARVVIADILPELESEAKALGKNALGVRLDVTQESDWVNARAIVQKEFGNISILVNNAGILGVGEITGVDVAEFRKILDVNLVGPLLGMKTFGPQMIEAKLGSVINISSTEGLQGTNGLAAYASSKWGVRGLTKVAAMEFSPNNVRVNSVHPGVTNTEMGNPNSVSFDEFGESFRPYVPMGRGSLAVEIANVCLFLASEESSFVSGAEITADGGMTVGSFLPNLPGLPDWFKPPQ